MLNAINIEKESRKWCLIKIFSMAYIVISLILLCLVVIYDIIEQPYLLTITRLQIYSSLVSIILFVYASKRDARLIHDSRDPSVIFFYDKYSEGDPDAIRIQAQINAMDRKILLEESIRFQKAKQQINPLSKK